MSVQKLTFLASDNAEALEAKNLLKESYSDVGLVDADVVVALGGDGFMLQTLHLICKRGVPVYGMNKGTVGFLMNKFSKVDLKSSFHLLAATNTKCVFHVLLKWSSVCLCFWKI